MRLSSLIMLLSVLPLAAAESITVQFTNEQPAGGFATSPVWVAAHDGTFDYFNVGTAASESTEALAELGVGAGLSASLGSAGVRGILSTGAVHPQFTPGETSSTTFEVTNPMMQRWFTFAFMLLPSNDFFYGNDAALAHEIFDSNGKFRGPLTIQIYANQGWEAFTEVDDVDLGPAFLLGRDPFEGTPETGLVRPLFSEPKQATYLAEFIGLQTPTYTLTDGLTADELLATIRIVPEPSSVFGLALVALLALGARRG